MTEAFLNDLLVDENVENFRQFIFDKFKVSEDIYLHFFHGKLFTMEFSEIPDFPKEFNKFLN